MNTINHADQCVGESMLSWVFYPNRGASKSCFVYPQYLFTENESYLIEESAFPERGSFIAGTTGRFFTSDLKEKYGELVVARADSFQENEKHGKTLFDGRRDENKYYVQINPDLPFSTLKFRRFGDDPISNRLIQVIEIATTENFESPFTKPVFPSDAQSALFLDEVVVRQHSDDGGERYYGPFLYSKNQDGSLTLSATEAHDYRIISFGNIPSEFLMPIYEKRGYQEDSFEEEACTFLEKSWVEDEMEKALATGSMVIDWLPESELLKSFNRVINAARAFEFKELGGSALTSLKNAVRSYGDLSLLPRLDEGRKQRLCEILTDINTLAGNSEDLLHRAFNEIDEERLASIVLDEKNYPRFEERLLESSGVRQKLDDAIKKIDDETELAKEKRDQYISEADEARKERDNAIEAARQAKRDAEKVQNEALGKIQEKLDGLEKEIAAKKSILDDLNRKNDVAAANKMRIETEINQIIDNLDDEITSSTKILESEILRKVVRKVSGATLDTESPESLSSDWKTRENESEMAPEEVIEDIVSSITKIGGRDVTPNFVVNLMICLMQGYITTFAGLPGTGKTSLCNILAGSLGLMSKDNPRERFTEINVENGWTSYKDYIGYWNPITKSYEQANAAIYKAMKCLTEENSVGVPPYVFLLDEANLSSIEHYWSPFLRAADSYLEKGADLPLGGSTSWKLPGHMRFLATVNFDHTTEELSKRFLDRSWVITLPPRIIDLTESDMESGEGFDSIVPFSYEKLMEIFYGRDTEITDQLIASLYGKLMAICQDKKYPVSPRSQLMMKRYIATATRLMHAELTNFRYAPLDFAFSQKVLPSISGTKENVAPLVDELIENCQQLEVTLTQLERMKKYGDESGFYQYFI